MLGETTLCFHLDVLYREEKFKVVWVLKLDFRWARKLANVVQPFCSRWVNLDPRSSVSPQSTQRNAEESGTKGFRHFLAKAVPPPKDRTEIAFSQNSLAVRGRILRDTVLQQILANSLAVCAIFMLAAGTVVFFFFSFRSVNSFTTAINCSSCTGFTRNAAAPSLRACSLYLTPAREVTTTTGTRLISGCSRSRASSSYPLVRGISRSVISRSQLLRPSISSASRPSEASFTR